MVFSNIGGVGFLEERLRKYRYSHLNFCCKNLQWLCIALSLYNCNNLPFKYLKILFQPQSINESLYCAFYDLPKFWNNARLTFSKNSVVIKMTRALSISRRMQFIFSYAKRANAHNWFPVINSPWNIARVVKNLWLLFPVPKGN